MSQPMQFVQFANGKIFVVDQNLRISGTIQLHPSDEPDEHYAARLAVSGEMSVWEEFSYAHIGTLDGIALISFSGTLAEQPEVDPSDFAEWVGLHYKINYSTLDDMAKADWLLRYLEAHQQEDGGYITIADTQRIKAQLKKQWQLSDVEVDHALADFSNDYGDENVLPIQGSHRAIHTPAFPSECDYVRVVLNGLEIAYWVSDEWAESPTEVMGAILGAANTPSVATA